MRYLFGLLIVLLISACTAPTQSPGTRTTTAAPESTTVSAGGIQDLVARADRADEPQASQLRLRAAVLSVEQNQPEQAARLLRLVESPYSTQASTMDHALVRARLAISANDPAAALSVLNDKRLQAVNRTPEWQITVGKLRSQAYRLNRSYVASARERIYFDSLLDKAARQDNHEAIFSTLLELPADSLVNHANEAVTNDLRGWLSLAAMTRQYQNDPLRQLQELGNWKKLWAGHPAASQLPAGLEMLSRVVSDQPAAIALLLPLQGGLAPYGRAIRDGILAAHYETNNDIPVRVYDTTKTDDVINLVQLARREGAELIIGPLSKDKVEQLVDRNLPIPVLALNRTDSGPGNPDLYQFGLAPEDEVVQIASRARDEGFRNALVLAPEGPWGERTLGEFRKDWLSSDGIIVDEARYSEQRDYSDLVKSLLKVDESQDRADNLRRIIGERFEFTPRRRQDVDFILLLGNAAQARGLNPTLAFFYADDLPVYSTSHVHEKSDSRIDNIDLNGIRFCDIPWKLAVQEDIHKEVRTLWPASRSLMSFYALGADAYRLFPRLQQLKEIPGERLFGATGILTLQGNTVYRQLMWGRFSNGDVVVVPMVLDAG